MDFKQAFYKEYKYYPTITQREDPQVISRVYKKNKVDIELTKIEIEQSRVFRFFPVMKEQEVVYYGGDQKWFSRETQKEGGCAPVAAANILACFAAQDKKMAEKLNLHMIQNNEETISKKDFTMLMHRAYNSMTMLEIPFLNQMTDRGTNEEKIPSTFGSNATGFLKGTVNLAAQNGIALKPHMHLVSYSDPEKSFKFIEMALKKGTPVVLLTTHNKHSLWRYNERSIKLDTKELEAVKSHFMTIVGVRNKQKEPQLIISSWGKLFIVDFKELSESWQSFSALGAGLFYFTKEGTVEDSRKVSVMANAYFPVTMTKTFIGGIKKVAKNAEKKVKSK